MTLRYEESVLINVLIEHEAQLISQANFMLSDYHPWELSWAVLAEGPRIVSLSLCVLEYYSDHV